MPEPYDPVRDMAFHDAMPQHLRETMANAMYGYVSERAYLLLLQGHSSGTVAQMIRASDMQQARLARAGGNRA